MRTSVFLVFLMIGCGDPASGHGGVNPVTPVVTTDGGRSPAPPNGNVTNNGISVASPESFLGSHSPRLYIKFEIDSAAQSTLETITQNVPNIAPPKGGYHVSLMQVDPVMGANSSDAEEAHEIIKKDVMNDVSNYIANRGYITLVIDKALHFPGNPRFVMIAPTVTSSYDLKDLQKEVYESTAKSIRTHGYGYLVAIHDAFYSPKNFEPHISVHAPAKTAPISPTSNLRIENLLNQQLNLLAAMGSPLTLHLNSVVIVESKM